MENSEGYVLLTLLVTASVLFLLAIIKEHFAGILFVLGVLAGSLTTRIIFD